MTQTAEKRAEPTPAYLAPCPFCGEQPTIEPWHGGGPNKLAVICESVNCFVGPMVTGESNQEAVTRWNWRAVKSDTAAERDRLRQTVIDGEERCIELLEERDRLKAAKDQAYLERNHLVAALARLYPSGIARTDIPGWSDDWHGCVYINLPSGQISYHYHDSQALLFEGLPPYEGEWDGHDKAEVHWRLAKLEATS